MRQEIHTVTERGVVLTGVLSEDDAHAADTVLICITGVHGSFCANPFCYNFRDALAAHGLAFIYAQTNDAFRRMESYGVRNMEPVVIGSCDEHFRDADEDAASYLVLTQQGLSARCGRRTVARRKQGNTLSRRSSARRHCGEHPRALPSSFSGIPGAHDKCRKS